MHPARIAELLQPFLPPPKDDCHSERSGESAVLSPTQLQQISTYINILSRWNARMNLTAVRQSEEIVTRHFGESLFAARCLFPSTPDLRMGDWPVPTGCSSGVAAKNHRLTTNDQPHLIDVGSGPGFPGLPIKIWAPQVRLTMIESNQKKAVFLREVTRALTLTDVDVYAGRAEDFPAAKGDVVTLRAVERFDAILPTAARLLTRRGRLALLVSQTQIARALKPSTGFLWAQPIPIPLSHSRLLLVGSLQS